MIYIKFEGHHFEYEIKEMMKQFFQDEEINILQDSGLPLEGNDPFIITSGKVIKNNRTIFFSKVQKGEELISRKEVIENTPVFLSDQDKIKWEKRKCKIALYKAMEEGFNRTLPWGILTGIRPSKIVHHLFDEGLDKEEVLRRLKHQYLISDGKADLLLKVAVNEKDILYPVRKDIVSVYVGIPFCPSRCIYCSFVSYVLKRDREILKTYVQALSREIRSIGSYLKEHKINIQSIYIGGGTPTILNSSELAHLLDLIQDVFDIHQLQEYTLEAGRPDTIDENKLRMVFEHGINRISINPQTMNERTLERIGRRHTPDDVIKAYYLAKQIGYPSINMDLILGLPGEGLEDVKKTLKDVHALQPENITLHTMSIKRGSTLKDQKDGIDFIKENEMFSMLDFTQQFLSENGYVPYYLYRQKYMMGNLENVGYSRENYRSIYNIQMMGEKQTIIGTGAGATTKIVFLGENRIERLANIKNVPLYIDRIQEMIDKKLKLLDTLYP